MGSLSHEPDIKLWSYCVPRALGEYNDNMSSPGPDHSPEGSVDASGPAQATSGAIAGSRLFTRMGAALVVTSAAAMVL